MSAEPDLVFLLAFDCLHCKTEISTHVDQPGAWVRCPNCGRASRAPAGVVRSRPVPFKRDEEVLRIDPSPDPKPMTPVAFAPVFVKSSPSSSIPGSEDEPASPWRVACGAGLFLAVTGLLFALVESSELGIVGFSITAVVLLITLIRTAPG